VMPGEVIYLVFHAPYGAPAEFTLALPPEEAGSAAIVGVRYSEPDALALSQARIVYRHFTEPNLMDTVVTYKDLE
jgi:hypothetical protein